MEIKTREDEAENNLQTLEKVYKLRYLCWAIVNVSFFWQILAISSSVSENNSLSGLNGVQFVANCAKEVENNNCQKVESSPLPYRCPISDGNDIGFSNFILNLSGLSATLIATYLSALPTIFRSLRDSLRSMKFIKVLLIFWVYIVPWLVTIFYVTSVGVSQARNPVTIDSEFLNTKYGCGINDLDLINLNKSSKTGYLSEWTKQRWTSFDKGFDGITRKIALL